MADIPNYKDRKPGDVIPVKVDGKVYETVIDENGVQRFRENSVLDYMFRHAPDGRELNMMDGRDIHNGMMNLNTLVGAFRQGKFEKRDFLEFRIAGHSVSWLLELSEFAGTVVENPLWDGPETIHDPFAGIDMKELLGLTE